LTLIAPIRPLQLCVDGGYQLRLGVLGVPLIMVPDKFLTLCVVYHMRGTQWRRTDKIFVMTLRRIIFSTQPIKSQNKNSQIYIKVEHCLK
jgi:hypothetical protein